MGFLAAALPSVGKARKHLLCSSQQRQPQGLETGTSAPSGPFPAIPSSSPAPAPTSSWLLPASVYTRGPESRNSDGKTHKDSDSSGSRHQAWTSAIPFQPGWGHDSSLLTEEGLPLPWPGTRLRSDARAVPSAPQLQPRAPSLGAVPALQSRLWRCRHVMGASRRLRALPIGAR